MAASGGGNYKSASGWTRRGHLAFWPLTTKKSPGLPKQSADQVTIFQDWYFGAVTVTYTAPVSGGVVFGGTAPLLFSKIYVPSGGVVFGGGSVYSKSKIYLVSGGVVFDGSGSVTRTFAYPVSGGIVFDGTAPTLRTYAPSPSGGVVFGGVAPLEVIKIYIPSDGVVFGGNPSYSFIPVGGPAATGPYRLIRIRRRS